MAASRSRKVRRFAARRTLWQVTGDKTCRGCGRTVMDPESGVILAQTAEGTSVVLGLLKCGKIWLCPVCSATIRNRRAEEISRAVVAWIQAGGQALMVTFTARHAATDKLSTLMDALQGTRAADASEIRAARIEAREAKEELAAVREEARQAVDAARIAAPKGAKKKAMVAVRAEWSAGRIGETIERLAAAEKVLRQSRRQAGAYQRLITGGTWAGRPKRKIPLVGIRDRIGYVGMIRATEITLGQANGWHPHIHAIVFIGGRTTGERAEKRLAGTFAPTPDAMDEFRDHFRGVWTNHLAKLDRSFKPSDRHGVDFKPLTTVQDAENLGQYIAKLQEGGKAISPANEVARGDNKEGRNGNVTPFQLLGQIGDLIGGADPEEVAAHGSKDWCLARWWEYEAAVKGRRAIEWTRYLRPLLGIEGDDTEQGDIDQLFEGEEVSEFRAGVRVGEGGWHKVASRGLDLAVIESAEGDGIDLDRVVTVVKAAGGSRAHVRLMSPGELEEARESMLTALASRRALGAARRKAAEEEQSAQSVGGEEARGITRK